MATILNPFPLPYLDSILDDVTNHYMYSFLDGFSGYDQICVGLKASVPDRLCPAAHVYSLLFIHS